MPADLVLYGGSVMTLDPARPEAQAVAVRGEEIVAAGPTDDILRLAGPKTRRIDLRGALVVPGLTDAHAHVRSLGEQLATLDLHGVASIADVVRLVRERDRALAGIRTSGPGSSFRITGRSPRPRPTAPSG